MSKIILFLILYMIIGYAMYFAAVHESLKLDRGELPSIWIVPVWPIVILLGIDDLVDWIIKKIKS